MSQIHRTGTVLFSDASINVWEEPKGPVQSQWERQFKKDVFLRMAQKLRRIGWQTEVPADDVEKYGRRFAEDRRYCQKGDLQGYLSLSGRHIEFNMWQDVANVENPNGGRYDFDKEKRMPYLLRLEMKRTRLQLRNYLCNVFTGYEFSDRNRKGRHAKHGPGSLTALEWVEQANRSSGHYDPELGHAPINMASNARSADGGTITHGARVYAIDYHDRMVVGTAFYNLNNMWWVVTGKYDVHNIHSGAIYLDNPGNLRRKRNEGFRRRRLEQELAKAVKAMDFRRAKILKGVIFPTPEPLYLIWHKGHGAYHRPGACGYTSDPAQAGKFTWDELGSYRPAHGSMEDDLSRIVPLSQGRAAA